MVIIFGEINIGYATNFNGLKGEIKIKSTANENEIKILVIAREEQIPRLIGKQGRNANAIRQLVRAAASEERKKVLVDFEAF